VHLAYGHRYRWYPLRTLTDILALTSRGSDPVDWDVLLDTAKRTRTAGAIYWPLRLGQRWLDAPVPEHVLTRLAPPAATRRLIERVLETSYVLDDRTPPEWGANVLYNLVRELSLYGGCSGSAQAGAVITTLFPPRHAIRHLSEDVTRSHLRYAAHWWNPPRLVRGMVAFSRLVAQRSGLGPVESAQSGIHSGVPSRSPRRWWPRRAGSRLS
jgi:hypothetical protein